MKYLQSLKKEEWKCGRDSRRLGRDGVVFSEHYGLWVDADALGGVVRLVDSDETIRDLKHVVSQRDDDELSVLGLLLQRKKRVIFILTFTILMKTNNILPS